MFHLLDAALNSLLDDPATQRTLGKLFDADTSFETPDRNFAPQTDLAVNLFLYEVKENLSLREALPRIDVQAGARGAGVRRRPPLRVDCSYLVTAWAKKPPKTQTEHQLLGEAFNLLNRFPVIPLDHLKGTGLDDQEFPLPAMMVQMDGAKSAGEFWHALGIAPRPYFNLTVTIAMDLDQAVEESLVTTIASRYQAGDPASGDERLIVGGTVRDRNQRPVADAWVRLEPSGATAVCDSLGWFVFERVVRGTGYTLRARSPGFSEAVRSDLEMPSLSGDYDLTFL